MAEGAAHLQLRGLAGLVAALLRDHIHAVSVVPAEPDLALTRHPHGGRSEGLAAAAVLGLGDEFHLAGRLQLDLAEQQAARVGAAAADRAEIFIAVLVVVSIEATDEALAHRVRVMAHSTHRDLRARQWLAGSVEREHLCGQGLLDRDPGVGAHAQHHPRRPDGHRLAQRLDLAVGVGVGRLHQQLASARERRQLGQRYIAGTVLVESDRELVRDELRFFVARAGELLLVVLIDIFFRER